MRCNVFCFSTVFFKGEFRLMKVYNSSVAFVCALAVCVAFSPIVNGETINIGRTFQGFSAADIDTTPTAAYPTEIQGINLGNVTQFGPLTADETIGGVTLLRQDNAAAAGTAATNC